MEQTDQSDQERELYRLMVKAWVRRTNAASELVVDCPKAAAFVASLDLRHFLSGPDLDRRAELLAELRGNGTLAR